MELLVQTTQHLVPTLVGARKAKGMTQAQLAAKVGLSQSRLSYLEKHPGDISLDQLLNHFSALGLELVVRERASGFSPHDGDASPEEVVW